MIVLDSMILLNSTWTPVLFRFNFGLFVFLTLVTILIETLFLWFFGHECLRIWSEKKKEVRRLDILDSFKFIVAVNVVSACFGVVVWILLGIGV